MKRPVIARAALYAITLGAGAWVGSVIGVTRTMVLSTVSGTAEPGIKTPNNGFVATQPAEPWFVLMCAVAAVALVYVLVQAYMRPRQTR